MWDLNSDPEDRFSHDAAHIISICYCHTSIQSTGLALIISLTTAELWEENCDRILLLLFCSFCTFWSIFSGICVIQVEHSLNSYSDILRIYSLLVMVTFDNE